MYKIMSSASGESFTFSFPSLAPVFPSAASVPWLRPLGHLLLYRKEGFLHLLREEGHPVLLPYTWGTPALFSHGAAFIPSSLLSLPLPSLPLALTTSFPPLIIGDLHWTVASPHRDSSTTPHLPGSCVFYALRHLSPCSARPWAPPACYPLLACLDLMTRPAKAGSLCLKRQ